MENTSRIWDRATAKQPSKPGRNRTTGWGGGLTSGTGDASFRRGGGDRTRTTSCRATRLDQKSPRGDRARPGRTCCGGGGSYARGRGRHGAEAIKARGLVAGRCGERTVSPAGRRGARSFWLSLGGGRKWGAQEGPARELWKINQIAL